MKEHLPLAVQLAYQVFHLHACMGIANLSPHLTCPLVNSLQVFTENCASTTTKPAVGYGALLLQLLTLVRPCHACTDLHVPHVTP